MVASVVEIWNLAMVRMGHDPIVDEDENGAAAEILRTVYPTQRDLMFENYDWDFGRRFGSLTDLNDEDELIDGWLYAYQWPQGNMVTFRGVANPIANVSIRIPFDTMLRVSGDDRKIMTDLSAANGFWTERITDVTRYTAAFSQALSYALQAEVVGGISKDKADQLRSIQLHKNATERAAAAVANQSVPRTPEEQTPKPIAARA